MVFSVLQKLQYTTSALYVVSILQLLKDSLSNLLFLLFGLNPLEENFNFVFNFEYTAYIVDMRAFYQSSFNDSHILIFTARSIIYTKVFALQLVCW